MFSALVQSAVLLVKFSVPAKVAKLPSESAELNSDVVPVIELSVKSIVLFVKTCVSVVPTTAPVGIAIAEAEPSILPEAFETTKLEAATPDIVLLSALIVLFVNMSVDVSVTIEPSVAKETLLAVTVVVIPEPPSKVNISPKATVSIVEESSFIDIEEFVNAEFAIFDNVLLDALITLLVRV